MHSIVRNRAQIGHQEQPVCACTAGAAVQIPGQQTAGIQSQRNQPLLVAFAVHNGVALRDVQMVKGKGYNLIQPQAAVQHEGAYTAVAQLGQIPEIETIQ